MHLHHGGAHPHEGDVVRGIQIPNHVTSHGGQSLKLRSIEIAALLAQCRAYWFTTAVHHDYVTRLAGREASHECVVVVGTVRPARNRLVRRHRIILTSLILTYEPEPGLPMSRLAIMSAFITIRYLILYSIDSSYTPAELLSCHIV